MMRVPLKVIVCMYVVMFLPGTCVTSKQRLVRQPVVHQIPVHHGSISLSHFFYTLLFHYYKVLQYK